MMVSILALVGSLAQSTTVPPPVNPPAQPTVEQGVDATDLGASTTIYLEGSAGYSSNPELETNSSGQAFGRVAINLSHVRQGARSSTVLSLYGENTTYSGRSGSQQLLRAMASHQIAVSEKLRMFGDLSASLDNGGQLGTRLIDSASAPDPVVPDVDPAFTDASDDLVLIGERTYQLSGQAGAQITLSQRDSMTIRSGAERVIFRGGQSNNNDFTRLFGSAAYDRQLNERASAGIQVDIRHSDYQDDRLAQELNPQVTGRIQIAERVELRAAAGVSFAKNDDGEETDRSVGLTFDGSICGRSEVQTFCARAAHDHQGDGISGASETSTLELNYSRQIDANQAIQLTVGASKQSDGFDSTTVDSDSGRQTYFRAAGSYTRNIGVRWVAGVNVAARSLRRDGPNPNPDVSASLFARWRVGEIR